MQRKYCYSLKEAAALVSPPVTVLTMRRRTDNGTMPAFRVSEKIRRILHTDLFPDTACFLPYGDLTAKQAAAYLGVSESTVKRAQAGAAFWLPKDLTAESIEAFVVRYRLFPETAKAA